MIRAVTTACLMALLSAWSFAAEIVAPPTVREHDFVRVQAVDLAEGERPAWLVQTIEMTPRGPKIVYRNGIVPADDPNGFAFTGPPGFYSVVLYTSQARPPQTAEIEIIATQPPPPNPDPDPGPGPGPDPVDPDPPAPSPDDVFGLKSFVKADIERRYAAGPNRPVFARHLADAVFRPLIKGIESGQYPGPNALFIDASKSLKDFFTTKYPGSTPIDWSAELASKPIKNLDDMKQAFLEIVAGLEDVK